MSNEAWQLLSRIRAHLMPTDGMAKAMRDGLSKGVLSWVRQEMPKAVFSGNFSNQRGFGYPSVGDYGIESADL